MNKNRAPTVAVALVLILLGALLLAVQIVPGLEAWVYGDRGWPLIVVAVGVALLLAGLVSGATGLFIPACTIGGIGGLLYWQNLTGHWESWAYAWTLVPGFTGVGISLAALLRGRLRELGSGLWLVFISLVLFAIFGSFLGGVSVFGPWWPLLIVGFGLVLLVRNLVRRPPSRGDWLP